MRKRLYLNAVITSPIIAVYGASPFYIFNAVDLGTFLILLGGLSVNVFLVWVIHIYFVFKYPTLHGFARFAATYLANVIVRLVFFFLDPLFNIAPPDFAFNYWVYPVLTSFALNAIIMVIVDNIVVSFKKAQADKENSELKFQNSEAQKRALMQQLHPHFLFNTLSVLKSLINENKEGAENYAVKLSDFLRYSIEAHKTDLVALEDELKFTNNYVELQKVRFGKAFSYLVEVPNSLLTTKIPVLALQTLVENAFKHNYFTEKKPMTLQISYKNNTLSVLNNKVSVKLTERTSTGLANLNRRYQLITGNEIKVVETDDSFCVTIELIN